MEGIREGLNDILKAEIAKKAIVDATRESALKRKMAFRRAAEAKKIEMDLEKRLSSYDY